jgi:flagellar basal body P-ring formation protein FlgA
MALWIDVLVDGQLKRTVLQTLEVKAYRQAWVARVDVPAGERLDADAFEQRDVDVAAAGKTPWTGTSFDGLALRRRLLAGDFLTDATVGPQTAISRGDRVRLISRSGDLEIVADAVALQAGDVGQQIQVRVDAARAAVSGRVVAPNEVELRP